MNKVVSGLVLPLILGRGRPKGQGPNIEQLRCLQPGDSIVEVPRKRMNALRMSAAGAGIKVTVRRMLSGKYLIMRIL